MDWTAALGIDDEQMNRWLALVPCFRDDLEGRPLLEVSTYPLREALREKAWRLVKDVLLHSLPHSPYPVPLADATLELHLFRVKPGAERMHELFGGRDELRPYVEAYFREPDEPRRLAALHALHDLLKEVPT